ncbi:MAG: 4a-hydroxytetrahydrobiopterin dehydratase [Acidimicrobiia bacterium]|nr:4a-hydroxytetrahydrobiopterin dehydratase [Acidimicrobiia bacterium]
MTTAATAEERAVFLSAHPAWSSAEEALVRTFTFADFAEAMGFVTRVALAAEAADHHPDLDIRWNKVTVRLTTHSAGTITSLDLALAARIDGFV